MFAISSPGFERHGPGYITNAPIKWEVGAKGSGLWLTVPKGFTFDVSVPRGLRWLFDPHDPRYLLAACLHDYAIHVLGWPRVSAASMFEQGLRAGRVGPVERLAMVLGVIVWKWR